MILGRQVSILSRLRCWWARRQGYWQDADRIWRAAVSDGSNGWERCHLCKGSGKRFEMEGWAAPEWLECGNCHGSGQVKTLPCGCTMVPPNIIASCYYGHGHRSGEAAAPPTQEPTKE